MCLIFLIISDIYIFGNTGSDDIEAIENFFYIEYIFYLNGNLFMIPKWNPGVKSKGSWAYHTLSADSLDAETKGKPSIWA